MTELHVVSALKERRAAVAGEIVELQRQIDRLTTDLFHIDSVLKLYDVDPGEIPTKGRVPKRSGYFGRNEITRRCYEALRTAKEPVAAIQIADQAMWDKGLDPNADRTLRINFSQRFLTSLHDLRKKGTVEQIGNGRGVKWRLANSV